MLEFAPVYGLSGVTMTPWLDHNENNHVATVVPCSPLLPYHGDFDVWRYFNYLPFWKALGFSL